MHNKLIRTKQERMEFSNEQIKYYHLFYIVFRQHFDCSGITSKKQTNPKNTKSLFNRTPESLKRDFVLPFKAEISCGIAKRAGFQPNISTKHRHALTGLCHFPQATV